MKKFFLTILTLLLVSMPVAAQNVTDSLSGTWGSGIRTPGGEGITWLIIRFNNNGQFERVTRYQDSEGIHIPSDGGLIKGLWFVESVGPQKVNVLCAKRNDQDVTVCSSYTITDTTHVTFAVSEFHKLTDEELKIIQLNVWPTK